MAVEEEYPIHPVLDRLIQHFKKFSNQEFPRGAPEPALEWLEVIKGLTKYEAHVVAKAYDYLCGKVIDTQGVGCPDALKSNMQAVVVKDVACSDFLNKLTVYRGHIEQIGFDLEDCVGELGNPCKQFRSVSNI